MKEKRLSKGIGDTFVLKNSCSSHPKWLEALHILRVCNSDAAGATFENEPLTLT
jgi:hypothetical protein